MLPECLGPSHENELTVGDLRRSLCILLFFISLSTGLASPLSRTEVSRGTSEIVVGDLNGNYIIPGTMGAVSYASRNGRKLYLDAFTQQGESLRPGVLVVHGGSWTSGSRVSFVGQFLETLTKAGFNWFSVDYRLANEGAYPASQQDIESAVEFIRSNSQRFKTDFSRFALLTEDSGAHPSLLLASQRPDLFKCVVVLGGIYDLSKLSLFESFSKLEEVLGEIPEDSDRMSWLRSVSPAHTVGADHPPTLLVHGTEDKEVPIRQAEDYCQTLIDRGSECSLFPIEGGIHRAENWLPAQWAYKFHLTNWMKKHLGDPGSYTPYPSSFHLKDVPYGTYTNKNGRSVQLLMDVFLQEGSLVPVPGVILMHGGGWEAGDKVTYLTPVMEPLAKAGFAWFSIDYRLTPDYRNWDQLDDLRRAIRYIRHNAKQFNVDPNKLVVLGESASGQLAVLAATLQPCAGNPNAPDPVEQESCDIQAVVSFYGVYNFPSMVKDASPGSIASRLFGISQLDEDAFELMRRFSPLFTLKKSMPPLLLINGTEDFLWGQALELSDKLKEIGAATEFIKLEGAPHGMENWEGHLEWSQYKTELVNWLNVTMRGDGK